MSFDNIGGMTVAEIDCLIDLLEERQKRTGISERFGERPRMPRA